MYNYHPWGQSFSKPRRSCFFSGLPRKVDASKTPSCAKLSTLGAALAPFRSSGENLWRPPFGLDI